MKKTVAILFVVLITSLGYSQELANYSFDDATSITNWNGVADATGADASGTNPLASLDFNESGNGTGALEISGVSDGPGKAFIFELLDPSFNYQGSGSINIAFDAKFVGAFSNSAFHFLTFTSGAGDTNFFDLQGQVNDATWTNINVNINGITNASTTLKISFQIAAGAIVGAGGTILIDNIVITGAATNCSDGIQNGDEEDIDCGGSCPPCTPDPVFDYLVWSDEFDTNGPIDNTKWFHQTQFIVPGGWANGEEQHYTNRIENSFVDNGFLNIVAIKESFSDQGETKQYTSARLNSKFAFTYGRVDVRAKLPIEDGTWPAIWTLGKNINEDGGYWDSSFGTVGWPACGEIDIMEHGLGLVNHTSSAIHTPSSSGNTVNTDSQEISDVENNFHVYSVNWSPNQITFLVDGVGFYTYNPPIKDASTWPFDADQYLLLNVAMGGIAGTIDPGFTQSAMEIDYVRVYQESALSISDENNFEEAKLFPNPVKDELTIQVRSNLLGAKATIYSILGQELHSFILKEPRSAIDLSHYEKGLYIVKFETNSRTFGYKVLKI